MGDTPKIIVDSYPAGSGKSTGMYGHILGSIGLGERWIIFQPEHRRLKESEFELFRHSISKNIDVDIEHIQSVENSKATPQLHKAMSRNIPSDKVQVLLCSHSLLKYINIAEFEGAETNIFIDEAPSLFDFKYRFAESELKALAPFVDHKEISNGIFKVILKQDKAFPSALNPIGEGVKEIVDYLAAKPGFLVKSGESFQMVKCDTDPKLFTKVKRTYLLSATPFDSYLKHYFSVNGLRG